MKTSLKYYWAFIGIVAAAFIVTTLTSCGPQAVAPVVTQPVVAAPAVAPVVVQQAAPAHDGFFTGLMMGHFMSSPTVVHAPAPSSVTVNKTVINKTVVAPQAPAPVRTYTPVRTAPAISYRPSTPTSSFSGGRR